MVKLNKLTKDIPATVLVKIETTNPGNSIKDRMALFILQQAYLQNLIRPTDTIIEATSGNTGIAFSAIGKALGHPVTIVMPNWLSKERIDIIKSLGADILLISKEEGGFLGSIKLTEEMRANSDTYFLPRQFENTWNAMAHEKTTGPEIWHQLENIGLVPDAFVAGVGTGGATGITGAGSTLGSAVGFPCSRP